MESWHDEGAALARLIDGRSTDRIGAAHATRALSALAWRVLVFRPLGAALRRLNVVRRPRLVPAPRLRREAPAP